MEFRIKHYKSFTHLRGGNITPFDEWWTVQRKRIAVWLTCRKVVPYSVINEIIRFYSLKEAEKYIEEQLGKTKRFKRTSEVIS